VTIALMDIPHGYYYFGIKAKQNNTKGQLFRMKVTPAAIIDSKPAILQSMFYINKNIKSSITEAEK
jgi:hypothetical protein